MMASTISHDSVAPVAFTEWIASIRHLLQPPVGNKMLFGKGMQKVMVVGGPNVRKDYHIEEGEEIFFQIEGDMCVEIYEHGKPKSVPIKEGHIFLLPGRIPHSPQRKAGTVGLVLERERLPGEVDGLRWYTADATSVLYEETFHCTDLGTQLKPVIERYFASAAHASGQPEKRYEDDSPVKINPQRTVMEPVHLRSWANQHANGHNAVLFGAGAVDSNVSDSDYRVEVKTQPDPAWAGPGWRTVTNGALLAAEGRVAGPEDVSELFLYQFEGEASVEVLANGQPETEVHRHTMGPSTVMLAPPGHKVRVQWTPGCLGLAITNGAGLRHGAK